MRRCLCVSRSSGCSGGREEQEGIKYTIEQNDNAQADGRFISVNFDFFKFI